MDEQHSRDLQQFPWTDVPKDIRVLEVDMFVKLSDELAPSHREWAAFCAYLNVFAPVPHTATETGFLGVGEELRRKGHIKTGCYDKLKQCLKHRHDLKAIVEKTEDEIKTLWRKHTGPRKERLDVTLLGSSFHVEPGRTIALQCTVIPEPSAVLWKKGTPEPHKPIVINNSKYMSGLPQCPSLVITHADKGMDDTDYICIATSKDGQTEESSIVAHLHVRGSPRINEYPTSHSVQRQRQRGRYRFPKMIYSRHQTRVRPKPTQSHDGRDALTSFIVGNDMDTSRQESKEDISRSLETRTDQKGRFTPVDFIKHCVMVSVFIVGASSPEEPSALCLAEQVKAFLQSGEILLSDESNTKLQIRTDDIKISLQDKQSDSCPAVSIRQAEYRADKGSMLVIHCTVLASPPATSVRWVKIRHGEEEEIDIDNDKYLGGGILSPSLVIADVSCTDEGLYMCYVTSSQGVGKSNKASLEINSDYTDLSTFLIQNGHDPTNIDGRTISCIKHYVALNNTSDEDVSLVRIAIHNDSRYLLKYSIANEPDMLYSRDTDGCNALHYCCQHGTLHLFRMLIESGMNAGDTTSDGSTCFMMATLSRSRQILQYVIDHFPEQLNAVNNDEVNGLLMSCLRDNIHIFELLVKAGMAPEHKDNAGSNCLMTAIANSNNRLARFIVENYPKQLHDKKTDGSNALMLCCREGNIEMFKVLITKTYDQTFDKGMTCLMVAILYKQRRLGKYIAEHFPYQLQLRNDDGLNALGICSIYGDAELFDYLIKCGMDPRTPGQDGSSCLMNAVLNKQLDLTRHILAKFPEQLEQRNRKGLNALCCCCQAGDVTIFDFLVEQGMKPNTRVGKGLTCLMVAALQKQFDLSQHIVDKYPEQLKLWDRKGLNALFYCCKVGDVKIFDYLVAKGLKPGTCSHDGSTCLMIAADNKQFDLTQHIVDKYPEQLEQRDQDGWNVLLYCCRAGDVKIFDYLVEKGLKPDTCSDDGSTCLMIAADNKQFDMTQHILDKYPEQLQHRNQNGWDPLLHCCRAGDVKIFDYLVEKGLKPDTCSDDGSTCLMIAADNKQFDMTQHILDKYPEQLQHRNQYGWDPLLHCCRGGDVKIFDYLVEKGLKPDTCSDDGSTCLMIAADNKQFDMTQHILDKYPEQLQHRNQYGWDPLLHCCRGGDVKIFDYLVEKGLKPDTCSDDGSTCLMIAADSKQFDMTQHIVDKYPEQLEQRDQDGWNVLFYCCRAGDVKIFDYLVEKGLKPDTCSDDGSTCLMIAADNKQFDMTQHILDKYPEQLQHRNQNGWDPLLHCCRAEDVKIFDYLVEKGLKPDTCSDDGSTCLMIAADNKQFDMTQHILDKYPEQLQHRNQNGWDPLLHCCRAGDVKIFDYLVEKGLKPDTCSDDGSTCLMIAADNKQFDMTQHILDKYPEQLQHRNQNGWDPLLHCCRAGDVKIFDYLVAKGLKPGTCSHDGSTCLMIAADNKQFDLTQHIVDKYPEQLEQRDQDGWNVLLYCCRAGDVKIFDYLVEKGLKPDTCSDDGSTCLMIAADNKQFDMTQHILDKYPEQLQHRNQNGWDPLLHCCRAGDVKIFDYHVEKGLKPDTRSNHGSTCLMIAAHNKQFHLTQHIVDKYPEQMEQRDQNGWNVLFYCCKAGDVKIFDYLVEKGLKPDTCSDDGSTCLMIAADSKQFDMTQHIVDKYPEQLEQRDQDGWNVLFYCCRAGDVKIFDYLVEKGLKPDTCSDDGSTCLMIAADNKQFDMTQHILDKYPEQLQHRNQNGWDPLLHCCRAGDVKIFDYLVEKGLKPDTCSDDGSTCLMIAADNKQFDMTQHILDKYPEQLQHRNQYGWDPLLHCCRGGDVKIFDYLVEKGLKPDTCSDDGSTCLMIAADSKQFDMTQHIVDKYPEQLEQRDQYGWDPLLHCCRGGDVKIFDYLVEKGLKPDTCSDDGSTCLMIAADSKQFDMTQHIVDKYPEQLEQRDQDGWNVLFYCCRAGDVKIFDYLVEKGLKPDTCSDDGSTCLMIAADNKQFDMTQHILDKYPEQLQHRNQNGWDPLLHCCRAEDVKIFDYLVEKGLKPDTCSDDGSTCLMIAADNKQFDMTQHILDKYPEQLQHRNQNGWDPLLHCCRAGDVKIFDYLVEKGLKPDTCSDDGSTCLMIAADSKQFDMTQHILDKYPEQLQHRNQYGWDPLLHCCRGGDVKIFDYLVKKGLKPGTRSNHGSTCLMIAAWNKQFHLTQHIVDRYPEQLEQRNQNGWNALLYCCIAGDVKIFDYLVEKGLKPDTRLNHGSTCLMIAAWNKQFHLTQHIVDRYPEQLEQRDQNGWNALLYCCIAGDVKIFDYLVEKGLRPDTRSNDGSTCLMIAARNKQFHLTQHIVDRYPEQLEQRDQNGWNALLYCCIAGDVKIFDYLVEKGLKPDTRLNHGSTCLMIAAWNKQFHLTQHIVDRYPEQLEQRDQNGWNALLYCCIAGDVKIFDYLVEKGLKPDTRSNDGSTCLMIAARNKQFHLTQHIVDRYAEQLDQRDRKRLDITVPLFSRSCEGIRVLC